MGFSEFVIDHSESQVHHEERPEEYQEDVKDEAHWVSSLHCVEHHKGPTFEGHTLKDGQKRYENVIEVCIAKVGVLRRVLPTYVTWGTVGITCAY